MFIRKLFLTSFLMLTACQHKQEPKALALPVTAIKIIPKTIPADFQYVGVAESSHIVELRARVEGYLDNIDYVEGSLVRKEQLMFVLDQRPFIAALEEAKGELARQKALLWNAVQSKNRMVPLYKKNAVSQKDYDDAIAQELAAEASVLTASANVYKAEVNLSFTSIQSPVNGMAGKSVFREGALISPGPNSLLTNIYVVDPIWVNFSVSEEDIIDFRQEVQKKLMEYPPDMNFNIQVILSNNTVIPTEGKIDFLSPALEQNTGTTLIRAVLSNPDGWLKPGQFVKVVLKGAVRPNAIIVPQTAVLTGQRGQFVYVVKDGKAEIQPVETGDWYENYWVITSGLKENDVVITQGVNKVQNGTEVTIKSWAIPPNPEIAETNASNTFVKLDDIPILY